MKKTINNLVIVTALLMILCSNIFAQGNFTTEWESPAGWSYEAIVKLNVNSDILSLVFTQETNENNVNIYNGATHALEYSWTLNASFPIYTTSFDINNVTSFDATGDGINEMQMQASSIYKIVNPANGNVLYSAGANSSINRIIDIDNDGYVELIEINNGSVKIISTPAQTVSANNQNEIIKDYELRQNYPNPFNPNTTIEYNLNRSSEVKVIIYDILGKEISTLVNEKQNTGKYKLNLNGSGLSSGTYFYSLVVNGLTDTKKMILIK